MKYKFNYSKWSKSGSCINPDIIYSSIGLYGHQFAGYLIKIAEHDGKWIYGSECCGGQWGGYAGPCSTGGENYKNRETCIESAVDFLLKNAYISIEKDIHVSNNSKDHKRHAQRFIDRYGNREQLNLF